MSTRPVVFKVALSFGIAICGSAIAQTSKEYAVMAQKTWAAFECSALAGEMHDAKEQKRLFQYGYQQGKRFIAAFRAHKVDQSDLSTLVPIGFLWVNQGPNADFILGRVYDSAQDDALKGVVVRESGKFNSEDEKKVIASSRFLKGNCRLIGQAN